ncbi:hypothetical protein GCM10025865_14460 [Paraoerskovia sediminicola]|uniref:histidine kinase n=2 Tax=Paraoerskovia sediminicola TaxID=1138587 RepID=A0ABM8G257_9CELL|nr:hypothetical protein GCM10025865_14460 [Paraoerskovia sediminicola]
MRSGEVLWSEATYAIYGFEPGEVVPTMELVTAHKHPDDRAAFVALLDGLRGRGGDFAHWHRVVDTRGRVRHVVTVGTVLLAPDGTLTHVEGYLVDISEPQSVVVEQDVQRSLAHFREGAAVIEQAKGALMVTRGADADEAFAELRRRSNETNVPLREVATSLLAGLRVDA